MTDTTQSYSGRDFKGRSNESAGIALTESIRTWPKLGVHAILIERSGLKAANDSGRISPSIRL